MRVLIAEDNSMTRLTLRSQLRKWGYEVVEAADGDAAWRALSQPDSPRLAVLDWMMPGVDGVELCRRVRARGEEPYTYILLLTGKEGSTNVVTGLDAGADDYVTKPFDFNELRVRVRAGQRICELQAEIIAARESLRHQATHDGLTNVWNRATILGMLEGALSRADRDGSTVGVAMIDFDHFKAINDTYGHPGGDAVLREGVARIQAVLRGGDHLGRYGGEELVAVLPNAGPDDVLAIGERMRAAIADLPIGSNGVDIRATVSIGVSVGDGSDGAPALVNRADTALYRAKATGRNRVVPAASPRLEVAPAAAAPA